MTYTIYNFSSEESNILFWPLRASGTEIVHRPIDRGKAPIHIKEKDTYVMGVSVLPTVCLCAMCMQGLQRPEEGTGSLGTGVKDSYELPCECWELGSLNY